MDSDNSIQTMENLALVTTHTHYLSLVSNEVTESGPQNLSCILPLLLLGRHLAYRTL